jgi:hypothetical protein
VTVELRDVAAGLWLWRQPHRDWGPGLDWGPEVSSFCVTSGGVTMLVDPLAPPASSREFWDRLGERPPSLVVILKPDHVRDVDVFVRLYGADAHGPILYFRDDVPATGLSWVEPGSVLPGGVVALDDGRGRNETPLWLPDQRALVFADGMTAPEGELRVWATSRSRHEGRVLPALRELLPLPFELVLVSHGEPVHTRDGFLRALELPPYGDE